MSARGERFSSLAGIGLPSRGRAFVGASIWQTPGGVQAELARINDDFLAFSKEITGEIERQGYPVKPGSDALPIVFFFRFVWTPLIQAWQSFYASNKGWIDNLWWNHAPEAEQFADQLTAARATAKGLGMAVMSPTPAHFAKSPLFDPGGNLVDKGLDGMGDLLKVAKYALYGGLGLVGVIAVSSLAQNLKAGKDPAQNYLALARRR